MSWVAQLIKTYDEAVAKYSFRDRPAPLAHMYANAQLEVTVMGDACFGGARVLDNEKTLIPVTEDSAGRTSGTAPHALCDNLSYVAGDCSDYFDKNFDKRHKAYMEQLSKWADSRFSTDKVRLVYRYLSKNCLIHDLVESGVVKPKDGKLSDKKEAKMLVRFRVLDGTGLKDAVWEDETLVKAFADFYLEERPKKRDLCYLTGNIADLSDNHPKGILPSKYGAKLMSANDASGFTFRGRFKDDTEASAISYEASQKIHSALNWLISTQGVSVGNADKRTFICWNPRGIKTPDIKDPFGLDAGYEEVSEASYRTNLLRAFRGYANQFDINDQINVIAFDAATPGRAAITYYQEMFAGDFLERVLNWGETLYWSFLYFDEKRKPFYRVETPTFGRIIQSAYGKENSGGRYLDVDDKVMKDQTERLLKCMLEGRGIPKDLTFNLVKRASTPLAYKSVSLRERVLSCACAAVAKQENNRKGDGKQMKLDLNNTDRSYLYGRLLAVLEKAERSTYDTETKREPNAIRYQAAFVNHPQQTWRIIEDILEQAYYPKLKPGSREYFKRLTSSIIESVRDEDVARLNQRLDDTYLLGYYLQRAELNKSRSNKESEEQ